MCILKQQLGMGWGESASFPAPLFSLRYLIPDL